MPNGFPNTPATLLARLEQQEHGVPNHTAWKLFFDLYHGPIKLAVRQAFKRCNWNDVSEPLLEETTADVVLSFFKADFAYDPKKGRFRNYIYQLARWRVQDQIKKAQPASLPLLPEHEVREDLLSPEPWAELLSEEQDEYRAALLATLLEDVRTRISPQTYLIFEMSKIHGTPAEEVARVFNVKRNVVDNAVYRVLGKLKELAAQPEYRKEYLP